MALLPLKRLYRTSETDLLAKLLRSKTWGMKSVMPQFHLFTSAYSADVCIFSEWESKEFVSQHSHAYQNVDKNPIIYSNPTIVNGLQLKKSREFYYINCNTDNNITDLSYPNMIKFCLSSVQVSHCLSDSFTVCTDLLWVYLLSQPQP